MTRHTRSQYVHDLVSGLIKLMASTYTDPVNIGTEDEATVLEWATMIRDKVERMRDEGEIPLCVPSATTDSTSSSENGAATGAHVKRGRRSEIVCAEAVVDDPPRRRPDISRAREHLQWQPTYSLEAGIEETIRSVGR